jgi:hypothetical protein
VPYLEPEHVLKRFSTFALSAVRPAIDDEFLQGQVGSMASTLRFLSMEVAGWPEAIERQQQAGVATDHVPPARGAADRAGGGR